MTRATKPVISFTAAVFAGVFSLYACARAPEPAAAQSAAARPTAVPAAAPAVGKWQAGTNYNPVTPPQPTNAAKGNVEVLEIFWYGCSHCFALDPVLETWRGTKAPYVEFTRVPVVWGPPHRQHAKLFYTLQALGRTDLHPKVFEAIHVGGKQLMAQSDEAARAMQLAFLKGLGVTEKDFSAAYDSMTVAINVRRAEEITARYAVSGVPLMIVNGKFTADVGQAGGASPLIALINDLAASEKSR